MKTPTNQEDTMRSAQRQFLTNHGFSRKGLDDVGYILDRLPTAKHDAFLTWITTPRPPFTSTSRAMTREDVQKAKARDRHDFLVFEGKELTDAETRALITEGVREEIREAINRITGRVN
jgi:hypothetical protein